MLSGKHIIRVTKEFSFEMAHALMGYDGPCKNIHGHSYKLSVTVSGFPESKKGDPKLGMVIDFSDLKRIVESLIVKELDHALVLNEDSPHTNASSDTGLFGKIVLKPYQPTCENLIVDFAEMIRRKLPSHIKIHHLKLQETATSFAEWYAEDQS